MTAGRQSGEVRGVDIRALACAAAAALGAALIVATYYPGLLNPDAYTQLTDARAHRYRDWHPPIMAALWSPIDALIPGAFGMLLLQNLVFWFGLALAVYTAGLGLATSVAAILAIGWFPPVFSALGSIWKDVHLGGALLLVFALLWTARLRASRAALVAALPLLFYACAVRHNAVVAVLPFALWIPFLWSDAGSVRPAARRRAPLLAGLVLFAAIAGGARAINRWLNNGTRFFPVQQILLHDLLAISVATGRSQVPEWVRFKPQPPAFDDLACLYTPTSAAEPFHGRRRTCGTHAVRIANDPEPLARLRRAWSATILQHPTMYAAHRWQVFRGQMGLTDANVCGAVPHGDVPNDLGLTFVPTALFQPAIRATEFAAYRTPLFRAWPYLIVLALVPLFARRHAQRSVLLVLSSSALLYAGAYIVVATSCNFRMYWWPIVATLLSLLAVASSARPSPVVGNGHGGGT